MKFITLLFIILIMQSCSIAPLSSNKSGRSYGPGNTQFEMGSVNSSYYLKLGFGATKDLDIGYVMEFGGLGTSGIFMKYSMLNQKVGPSHALEFGYGGTDTSNYYYAGLVSSLAFNEYFEVFINPRLVKATTDDTDISFGEATGNVIVTEEELAYLYVSTGMNIWISDTFGLSIYTLYLTGDGLETEENFTSAATAMFRF
jgi:hypothetical protein